MMHLRESRFCQNSPLTAWVQILVGYSITWMLNSEFVYVTKVNSFHIGRSCDYFWITVFNPVFALATYIIVWVGTISHHQTSCTMSTRTHTRTHARAALSLSLSILYNITHSPTIHSRHIALRPLNTVHRRVEWLYWTYSVSRTHGYTGSCFVYYNLPNRNVFIRLSTNGIFYFIHERWSVGIQLGWSN